MRNVIMINETIYVGKVELKNRLVMPPMATGKSASGIVTDDLLDYYRERADRNGFGLIITEHSCITEAGQASKDQLSISADDQIPGLKRITDVIHESGTAVFAQLNHAGSAAMPFTKGDNVSASAVNIPAKNSSAVRGC